MSAEANRTNSKSSWSTSGMAGLPSPPAASLLLFQALGGVEVGAAEGAEIVLGEGLLDLLPLRVGEVRVLVELRLNPLDLLEPIDEPGAGLVAHQVIHLIGPGLRAPAIA